MRALLWDDADRDELRREAEAFFDGRLRELAQVFVAEGDDGRALGFIELSIRTHGADGCKPPVPYVEGWYVVASARRRGVGRALMEAAEAWARAEDYTELGSDALLDNEPSLRVHLRLGFEEIERLIKLRKTL